VSRGFDTDKIIKTVLVKIQKYCKPITISKKTTSGDDWNPTISILETVGEAVVTKATQKDVLEDDNIRIGDTCFLTLSNVEIGDSIDGMRIHAVHTIKPNGVILLTKAFGRGL